MWTTQHHLRSPFCELFFICLTFFFGGGASLNFTDDRYMFYTQLYLIVYRQRLLQVWLFFYTHKSGVRGIYIRLKNKEYEGPYVINTSVCKILAVFLKEGRCKYSTDINRCVVPLFLFYPPPHPLSFLCFFSLLLHPHFFLTARANDSIICPNDIN